MKIIKIIILVFFLVLLGKGVYSRYITPGVVQVDTSGESPTIEVNKLQNTKIIKIGNSELNYEWFKVTDASNIFLYLNTEKLDSKNIVKLKDCARLTNAGFYSQDNTPLGLIISENNQLSKIRKSDLFNGFYVIDIQNRAQISREVAKIGNRVVLQSGPLVIKETIPEKLKIVNDKQARRVVVAIDLSGSSYFMVVYSSQSLFSGPNLSDLPSVIKNISDKENLNIKDALNLDGGAASAFFDSDLKLTELTHIGSYFCVLD